MSRTVAFILVAYVKRGPDFGDEGENLEWIVKIRINWETQMIFTSLLIVYAKKTKE